MLNTVQLLGENDGIKTARLPYLRQKLLRIHVYRAPAQTYTNRTRHPLDELWEAHSHHFTTNPTSHDTMGAEVLMVTIKTNNKFIDFVTTDKMTKWEVHHSSYSS